MKFLIVCFLACASHFAALADSGGGQLPSDGQRSKIAQYLVQPARTDLIRTLQSLTPEMQARIVPPDLNVQMLVALVSTVDYQPFSAPTKPSSRSVAVDATASLNKISPEEIKQIVGSGHDLTDPKIRPKLSPIVFNIDALEAKQAQPAEILRLVYFMQLIQLGKTYEQATRCANALRDAVLSRSSSAWRRTAE